MAGLQYCTLLGNKAAWNSTMEMKAIVFHPNLHTYLINHMASHFT